MQPLTQVETTLLIAGALLLVAMAINLISTRTFYNISKLKEKTRADLEETIKLRNVMLDERLAAKDS